MRKLVTKGIAASLLLAAALPGSLMAASSENADQAPATSIDSPADLPIRQMFDVRTRMRDGTELSSDVWLPRAPGRYPVILLRTPYIKTMPEISFADWGSYFAKRGYAFVVQDVRGRGDSGGEFNFFFQEADDGYDSVEGLAKAEWANGRVCMIGVSYWATVQWLAARERPPHLSCIAPTSPAGRYMDEIPAIGGAFMMQWALTWLNDASGRISQGPNARSLDWERIFAHRPLNTMDEAMGRKMRLYREFLEHDTLDEYWKRIQFSPDDFARIDLPVLSVTGLFDGDQTGSLFYWNGMERYSKARVADRYLVIGPWSHIQSFLGGEQKMGEFEFSSDSIVDIKALHLRFFDAYLKQSGSFAQPRVSIYMTGANQWRTFDHFPLPQAKIEKLYFSSQGNANSTAGKGALSWDKPTSEPADRFLYDPKKPVPFTWDGGTDRRDIQKRDDVLVYTSAQFARPVEVVGPVSVELYAASDARDTDFTAVISDVYPDGRALYLGQRPVGIVRARYRNGYDKMELLTPGKVEQYIIDLGTLAHSFGAGHSIRIEISSSAYPMFNPNQNTGNKVATDTEWKTATQTIFHDARRPSALVLPVLLR